MRILVYSFIGIFLPAVVATTHPNNWIIAGMVCAANVIGYIEGLTKSV